MLFLMDLSKWYVAAAHFAERHALIIIIEVLVERFPNKEDITHRKARSFLAELLKGRAKATVQKYTIAYRGV